MGECSAIAMVSNISQPLVILTRRHISDVTSCQQSKAKIMPPNKTVPQKRLPLITVDVICLIPLFVFHQGVDVNRNGLVVIDKQCYARCRYCDYRVTVHIIVFLGKYTRSSSISKPNLYGVTKELNILKCFFLRNLATEAGAWCSDFARERERGPGGEGRGGGRPHDVKRKGRSSYYYIGSNQ